MGVQLVCCEVFAESMQQAYDKQQRFVAAIRHAEVTLVSKARAGEQVALVFDYLRYCCS
jgi:hypothetical protein